MPLANALRQVARFLQQLSLLDAKTSQIFRWKYFYWNCWELWTAGL